MALRRRRPSSKMGVFLMALGLGILWGGLSAGCGGPSVAEPASTVAVGIPPLDKEQPAEVQTASFALG